MNTTCRHDAKPEDGKCPICMTPRETKHTPSPWMMLQHPKMQTWIEVVEMKTGQLIAKLWGHSTKEAVANGKLVVAAPELLDAAKKAAKFLGDAKIVGDYANSVFYALRDAIAKAEAL